MKKLLAITLCLSVIALFAFQKKDSVVNDTPSVASSLAMTSDPVSNQNPTDTTDIDEQMKKLEAEMKVLELKMKPYEQEMKQYENKMKPHQIEMREWELKMKPFEKQMHELEAKMKKAKTDDEREAIGKEMGIISDKMGDVGTKMGNIGDKMGDVGTEMGAIGDKMGKIGNEMGVIGDKMGIIGEQMEKRHKKIFSWFFQELQHDGLLKSNKCSIMMEEGIFIVNGQSLSAEVFQKYKKGIEQRLGKALKPDFSFYFKGTISNMTEEGFDFDGNMNSYY